MTNNDQDQESMCAVSMIICMFYALFCAKFLEKWKMIGGEKDSDLWTCEHEDIHEYDE